jgi:hypothetical protein
MWPHQELGKKPDTNYEAKNVGIAYIVCPYFSVRIFLYIFVIKKGTNEKIHCKEEKKNNAALFQC